MPSLDVFRENFYEDSAKVSDSLRKASLSAIAAIWIIASTPKNHTSLIGKHTHLFIVSGLIFLIVIICDLLQNIAYTFLGWSSIKKIEKERREKPNTMDEYPVPKWQRNTGWFFFILKIFLSTIGTTVLITGLVQVLK